MLCTFVLACVCAANAEDWVIGFDDPNEAITLTSDRYVAGDVIIVNAGRLSVTDGATLTVAGMVQLLDAGELDVTGADLRFVQAYSYQDGFLAVGDTLIQFTDATIRSDGGSYVVALTGNSRAEFNNVTVEDGFATWGLYDSASASLSGCTNGGEFLTLGDNELSISDTETVIYWLTLIDGSVVDTTMPPPGDVASFQLDPNTPWAGGIPYTVTITNCTNVVWAVMASSGSQATFRDSELRLAGSIFERDNDITIEGLANQATFADTQYDWGDVSLRFVNTSVETWNFYCYGNTHLTLRSCVFGELLTEQNGESEVIGSLCDGAGGYIGASGNGVSWLINSTNLSQTTVSEQALLFAWRSALLGPNIDAVDNAIALLLNAEYSGEPEAHDAATIFDAAIDPVEVMSGDTASLRGTARMLTGPDSPFTFEGYTLEYGVGDEPAVWTQIGEMATQQVRDAQLGVWNACGRVPGDYNLRLSLFNGTPEPVRINTPAGVGEPPEGLCLGDLNCDGGVFLSDLSILLAAYGVDGAGDLDGDGDTDVTDLGLILANWEVVCP